MRMRIVNAQIGRIVQSVIGVVEPRSALPVLSHVLLERRGNQFRAVATDSEVELEAIHELDDRGEDFRVLVQARKFHDLLKSFSDETVFEFRLEPGQERLEMASGKSRFVLATLPAEEFPLMRQEEARASVGIASPVLLGLLRATSYAMAQGDSRHYLNGLFLVFGEGKLRAVATDGHRLAIDEADCGGKGVATNLILPRKAVLEAEKILASMGDLPLSLDFSDNTVRFTTRNLRLSSRIMPGKDYPDYQRVIPVATDKGFSFKIKDLSESVRHARALVGEKYAAVTFQLSGNVLRVLSRNKQGEHFEESLDVEKSGEDIEIAFNADYVLEALGSLRDEMAAFRMTTASASSLLEPIQEEGRQKAVIMPLRI